MANAAIDLTPQDSNHLFMNQRLIWIGRILLGLVVIGIVLPGQVVVEQGRDRRECLPLLRRESVLKTLELSAIMTQAEFVDGHGKTIPPFGADG